MKLSPCGVDCGGCPHNESCSGCQGVEGKPFFLQEIGVPVCPLYECPVSKKSYQSCAECAELPCQLYTDWRDPSMSDEQHQASIDERVKNLRG